LKYKERIETSQPNKEKPTVPDRQTDNTVATEKEGCSKLKYTVPVRALNKLVHVTALVCIEENPAKTSQSKLTVVELWLIAHAYRTYE